MSQEKEVAGHGSRPVGGPASPLLPSCPQVQCFDPKEDHWSLRSPAPFSQRCLEAVSLEDTIYVVGGLMDKIFTYDPGTDVWGEAAVLPSPVVSGGSGYSPGTCPSRTVNPLKGPLSWKQ